MAETSQSAMRVIALVLFTSFFAGAWANDQPRERLALKEPPKATTILSQEDDNVEAAVESNASESNLAKPKIDKESQVGTTPTTSVPAAKTPSLPVLEELKPVAVGMMMTISVETEGLTLADKIVQQHIRRLPLGIGNGDYLMVDPDGGVGWLRIRGQQQTDSGETMLSTTIDDAIVRYVRVTPVDAVTPNGKAVPTPIQYAGEELKTVR